MSVQPRDSKGRFVSPTEVKSEGEVSFLISEFESRVVGNRLSRAADRFEEEFDTDDFSTDQDCRFWASRFLNACCTREKNDEDYYDNGEKRHVDSNHLVRVIMTNYECWSIANRLFEIGEYFEKHGYYMVGAETKWLARRFHAEEKLERGE